MATNPTIKQHEPLRVPDGWGQQERRFVLQLEDLFDDIYKSFSRITLDDLQKDLRMSIISSADGVAELSAGKIDKTTVYQTASDIVSTAETYTNSALTNYSTNTQTSTMISQYVMDNAYSKQSGITITAAGIDISGSQYVKIDSGGYFKVTTGTFGIDTSASDYVLWAGALSPANAYFWIKKNGDIYAASGQFKGTINVNNGAFQVTSTGRMIINTTNFKVDQDGGISYIDTYSGFRFDLGGYYTVTTNYTTIGLLPNGPGTDHQRCMAFSLADDSGPTFRYGYIGIGVVYNARRADLSSSAQQNWEFGLFPLSSKKGALGSSGKKFATVWSKEGNFDDLVADTSFVNNASASSSSREVKHNIQPLDECGEILDRLIPSSFAYNHDPDERRRYGLIWEEAVNVLPEICLELNGEKGITYTDLIPLLLREIQSLRLRMKLMEEYA